MADLVSRAAHGHLAQRARAPRCVVRPSGQCHRFAESVTLTRQPGPSGHRQQGRAQAPGGADPCHRHPLGPFSRWATNSAKRRHSSSWACLPTPNARGARNLATRSACQPQLSTPPVQQPWRPLWGCVGASMKPCPPCLCTLGLGAPRRTRPGASSGRHPARPAALLGVAAAPRMRACNLALSRSFTVLVSTERPAAIRAFTFVGSGGEEVVALPAPSTEFLSRGDDCAQHRLQRGFGQIARAAFAHLIDQCLQLLAQCHG